MKRYVIVGLIAMGLGGAVGCAHQKPQHAPDVAPQPAPAAQAPEKPNWLARTADGAWEVVQTPAKMMTPKPKVKKTPPEHYEPADVMIMDRSGGDEEEAEPATSPATLPK